MAKKSENLPKHLVKSKNVTVNAFLINFNLLFYHNFYNKKRTYLKYKLLIKIPNTLVHNIHASYYILKLFNNC